MLRLGIGQGKHPRDVAQFGVVLLESCRAIGDAIDLVKVLLQGKQQGDKSTRAEHVAVDCQEQAEGDTTLHHNQQQCDGQITSQRTTPNRVQFVQQTVRQCHAIFQSASHSIRTAALRLPLSRRVSNRCR